MKKYLIAAAGVVVLSGCSLFNTKKDPLEGHREMVFLDSDEMRVDSSTAIDKVALNAPVKNTLWSVAGGNAAHDMAPAAFGNDPQKVWEVAIGQGGTGEKRLLNGPVIARGVVFAVDAVGLVSAVSLEDGTIKWQMPTLEEEAVAQPFGGGLAWDEGRLYVTTPTAELICLSDQDGSVIWREKLSAPVRSSPTISEGRVYVATVNNQMDVFSATKGERLWSHAGIVETAGLLGGASPAIQSGVVVVPYTSGEIYALKVDNGYPLWSESLSVISAVDSVSALAHIKARPIIHNGFAYLISHGGRMSAINVRSGETVWSRSIGGIRSPAISGEFLFMLTNDHYLVCFEKGTGNIVWTKDLPARREMKNDGEQLLWAGPVLVGNHLVLVGSHGKVIFCSAQGGEIEKVLTLEDGTFLSPVIADGTLVFLTHSGRLVAYR